MDNLSKHIQQANKDVEDVHISATKISSRFEKIEKVELKEEDVELLDADIKEWCVFIERFVRLMNGR